MDFEKKTFGVGCFSDDCYVRPLKIYTMIKSIQIYMFIPVLMMISTCFKGDRRTTKNSSLFFAFLKFSLQRIYFATMSCFLHF